VNAKIIARGDTMLAYKTPAEIIGHDGLRLVLVRGVPSPWSQAAKTILEIKSLDYVAAPLMKRS
jgi:hypothetical protein